MEPMRSRQLESGIQLFPVFPLGIILCALCNVDNPYFKTLHRVFFACFVLFLPRGKRFPGVRNRRWSWGKRKHRRMQWAVGIVQFLPVTQVIRIYQHATKQAHQSQKMRPYLGFLNVYSNKKRNPFVAFKN